MESEPSNLLPSGFRYELHKAVTATDIHLWTGLTGKRPRAQGASAFAQRKAVAHQVAPDAYLTGLVVDTASCLAARGSRLNTVGTTAETPSTYSALCANRIHTRR